MMSVKPFHFKQFSVNQNQCAMKIGTDGVLLGAWASLENTPQSVLDIGTGTGIIALMLAQRSDALTIDAVELDDKAYEQATENFENSSWNNRLFCYHAHLYEYAAEVDERYDLIICNPPFHRSPSQSSEIKLSNTNSLETAHHSLNSRQMARFEDAMPFELLVGTVQKLLSVHGYFNTIIPYDREEDFILLCARANLFLTRITRVKGTLTSEIKRSLMTFRSCKEGISLKKEENSGIKYTMSKDIVIKELIIEESRHSYTEDYKAIVKDFYLKM